MKPSPSRFLHYALLATMMLLFFACANMGTPDGGPYDETPPKVVRTSPKFGITNAKNVKKIVIEFDEMVKIENAMEKVVISPPQIEQPEIEATGKRVTVTLLDSLKPNMTYTIDFSDAIVDNNEGNPYGDYAFTFSTGEQLDTFQVSGHVLDASDLEPIKGMLVGLYKIGGNEEGDTIRELPDSIFRTTPFERISRTDGSGHFVVKGLSPGKYRVFALNDQNQNFIYDQRAEKIAFSHRILETSSKPDLRPDTVWHDSIHYDSIVMVPYTHYYPDDIVLLAFESAIQDRYLLKSERPILQMFSIYFTAPSDTLPKLTGLNFDAENAFIIDASPKKDTLNYWIKDSLIYNMDTLEIKIDFFATDTTGNLALTTDTLFLDPKLSKEKLAKQEKEKYEEWVKEYKQKLKEEQRAAKRAEKQAEQKKGEEQLPDTEQPEGEMADTAHIELVDTIPIASDTAHIVPLDTTIVPLADTINTELSDTLLVEFADTTALVLADSLQTELSEPMSEVTDSIITPTEEAEPVTKASNDKKKQKKKKDEDEDIEIPPMPEEFLEFKISNAQSLDPDKNIDFEFNEPLDSIDLSKIHFSLKVDSLFEPAKFLFRQIPGKTLAYRLYAEWEPDSTYQLDIDTAAFVNIYGKRSEAQKRTIKVKSLDTYSTLFVVLQGADSTAVVQLLDGSDKVVKTVKSKNGKADFYFINPGTYYMRLFEDLNGNGEWDTGDYDTQLQPEPVYYYPDALTLKAQWEITQNWNPTARPRAKQKPEKITKQKADKAKTIKNKNEERLRNKRK